MRVLVLGAYGMLGHRLLLQLARRHDVKGTCRTIKETVPDYFLPRHLLIEGVDASDFPSVGRCVSGFDPGAIVNCIGIVKQSPLARSPVQSILINSLFPHQLAELCAQQGIRLLHFSTDCVFSGRKGHYGPGDVHDADDLYGRSKSLGELDTDEGVTVRSSMIGREIENSHGLLEWLASSKGSRVKGFTNAIFSGLTTHEMAKVVDLILEDRRIEGVIQVASDPISKFDLLSLIVEEVGIDVGVEPFPDFHCDRSLDGSQFEKGTGYRAPAWDSMIESMARDWHVYDEFRGGSDDHA